MSNKSFRPTLADKDAPVDGCKTVFVGFPIWWYVAPTIINSFLEAHDFSGKTVVLFATSGGSAFGKTAIGLQPSAPHTRIVEGAVLNGRISDKKLQEFANMYP